MFSSFDSSKLMGPFFTEYGSRNLTYRRWCVSNFVTAVLRCIKLGIARPWFDAGPLILSSESNMEWLLNHIRERSNCPVISLMLDLFSLLCWNHLRGSISYFSLATNRCCTKPLPSFLHSALFSNFFSFHFSNGDSHLPSRHSPPISQ